MKETKKQRMYTKKRKNKHTEGANCKTDKERKKSSFSNNQESFFFFFAIRGIYPQFTNGTYCRESPCKQIGKQTWFLSNPRQTQHGGDKKNSQKDFPTGERKQKSNCKCISNIAFSLHTNKPEQRHCYPTLTFDITSV